MIGKEALQTVATKHLLTSVIIAIGSIATAFTCLVVVDIVQVEILSKTVDAILKASAVVTAGLWTLNRYYMSRTDEQQIRIDAEVKAIRTSADSSALLFYRIDIVNTGKSLLPAFRHSLTIDGIRLLSNKVEYEQHRRWPQDGTHHAGPIEPGSWSAISDAVVIPSNLLAVRVYLELESETNRSWTWHKIFDIHPESSGANEPK